MCIRVGLQSGIYDTLCAEMPFVNSIVDGLTALHTVWQAARLVELQPMCSPVCSWVVHAVDHNSLESILGNSVDVHLAHSRIRHGCFRSDPLLSFT
jgi:hypothetical protein